MATVAEALARSHGSTKTVENDEVSTEEGSSQGLLAKSHQFSSSAERRDGRDEDSESETVVSEEDKKYPRSVFFIFGNEMCERFSFYGLKAILPLYLTEHLNVSEDTATACVHAFIFGAYAFPIIGGWLSDSVIGKYRTILYLSMVYVLGSIVLSVTAIPGVTGDPPHWWGCLLGLTLIAFGTGGIKPCVSSFGGDQFKPTQTRLLQSFFSLFYISINVGSIASTFLTPIIRKNVSFWAAFLLPAVLLAVATFIFWLGQRFYRQVPLGKNMIAMTMKVSCVGCNAGRRAKRGCCGGCFSECIQGCFCYCHKEAYKCCCSCSCASSKNETCIDMARPVYGDGLVEDVKATLRVLVVFIPLPIFWSLFDQHASRWVFQAKKMNRYGVLEAEQIQLLNPLLVVLLVPLFEFGLYPLARKIGLSTKELRRMWVGMLVIAGSFVVAAFLQLKIDDSQEGTVSVFWQIPQFALLSVGEIMVSITGLEFAYKQAPKSMKSVIMACFLLTTAIGNALVVAIAESQIFESRALEFIFFAGLMVVTTFVFLFLTRKFKYKTIIHDADPAPSLSPEDREHLNAVDSAFGEDFLEDSLSSSNEMEGGTPGSSRAHPLGASEIGSTRKRNHV